MWNDFVSIGNLKDSFETSWFKCFFGRFTDLSIIGKGTWEPERNNSRTEKDYIPWEYRLITLDRFVSFSLPCCLNLPSQVIVLVQDNFFNRGNKKVSKQNKVEWGFRSALTHYYNYMTSKL